MEHKLILGGEIYLPFARSRIKALRATGLEYASQQFEMGDASVKVRIMPGHEYIYLSGGGQPIAMDSGIVDIRSISFQNTDPALGYAIPFNIYCAGKLYLTEHVKQYTSIFTDGGPPKGFTHKAKSGQIAGTLEVRSNDAKGYVLKDNGAPAVSFSPGMIKNEITGKKIDNLEDTELAGKKYGARWCPPSMFTGKCRMYVQALMGSPLYDKHDKTKVKPHPHSDLDPYKIGPQNLIIPGFKGGGEVIIDTSTGVYLDKTTNKHWLFVVRANQVYVYPLAPSNAGRAALSQLKKLPAGTDFDHLESYILSESYPVFAERQTIKVEPGLAMRGCGYGWHWAWSTATADIVENLKFDQDQNEVNSCMESTHFRISFTSGQQVKDGVTTTVWDISRTVVSGPTKWTAQFQLWCIAFPMFGANLLEKLLPKKSILFDCGGPFYVFYKRDELCVCTFQGKVGDREVTQLGPTFKWYDNYTVGTRGGGDSITSKGEFKSGNFKIGGLFTTPVVKTQANYTSRNDLTVGAEGALAQGFSAATNLPLSVDVGYPINSGDPGYSYAGPQVWETFNVTVPDYGYTYSGGRFRAYTYTRSHKTQSFYTQNIAAIPFYDAEAIYVYSDSQETNEIIDEKIINGQSRYMSSITQISSTGQIFESFMPWQFDSTGAGDTTPPSIITTYSASICSLICSSGVAPAKFSAGLLQEFSSNLQDVIEATFATTSGINTFAPLMIAPGVIAGPVGVLMPVATDEFPIIVGYA